MNGDSDDADGGEGPKINRWGIFAGKLEGHCNDAGEKKGKENEMKTNAWEEEHNNPQQQGESCDGAPHTSKITTTSLTDWIITKKVNKDINEATSSHPPTDSTGDMSPFEKQRIDQCIKIAHLVVGKLSKSATTKNGEGEGATKKSDIVGSRNSNTEVGGEDDCTLVEGAVSVTDWEPKPKEICEDCITVTGCAHTGDVVDVGFDIYQNFDWDDGIEEDVNAPSNDRQKLGLIFDALGKLFYRLFMQGEPMPPCPMSTSSDVVLYNDNDNDSSIPSEDDILESFRQLSSSGAVNKKNQYIASSMRTLGKLPVPICQLVEDLFDTSMAMQKGGLQEHESGDSCFASLSDLHSEIQHMIDSPDALLYGTITSRWELVFDNNHMFGRENELKQLLDIAHNIQPSDEVESLSVLENTHPVCQKKNEVVMVKGYAGSGKTRLVNEIRKPLQAQGWLFLRCKFGKTSSQTESLSVISIGFDEFFSSGVVCDAHAVDTQDDTATSACNNECANHNSCCPSRVLLRLEKLIGIDGLKLLSQQMPSLRNLIDKTYMSDTNGETTGKFDGQHLFGALLDTLVSFCPVSFFVDDLQWADMTSVKVLTSLINSNNIDRDNNTNRVLFVGTYRDDTITEEAPLMPMLKLFEESDSVNVTRISLHGFKLESLNQIVSEVLCIPRRKSKSLAQIIHLKTQGFPLFLVEFLDALWTEKLLVHDPMNGWEWDVDIIDLKGISSNVAELLSSKLSSLPPDFLKSLQVLSCFGSHVDVEVLEAVKCYDGSPGTALVPSLLSAQNEGLIEKVGPTYIFTHDIIQQAAYGLIPESERMRFLQKLVSCLIPLCTQAGGSDNLLFVTVDLIDRIGSGAISGDPKLYAKLNLEAGEKYMKASDFSSAVRHFNSGISFLGETLWRDEYDLTLRLFECSALAYYSQGNYKKVASQVNQVLDTAKNFEDKFKSYCLFINVIAIGSVEKAIAKLYEHLQYLGERIDPNMISPPMVLSECIAVRSLLSGNQKEILLHLTQMTNQAKLRTMKLMSMLVMYSNQQKSLMGGYLACRMIRISIEYGHCEDTLFALAAFSTALVNRLNDAEEGYALTKIALALMKYYDTNKLIPRIYWLTHGVVLLVKDPMQSLLDPLLQACRLSFENGDHEHSTMNTVCYLSRCLHAGKKIPLLMNEISAFAQQHKQQNQLIIMQLFLAPCYKTLSTISGIKLDPSNILVQLSSAGNEDIVETAMVKNEMVFVQCNIAYSLTQAFYCRDFNRASKIIQKYQNFFQMLQGQQMSLLEFESVFIAGLVSFHMARENRERFWMERGMNVLAVYEKWSVLNEWNFSHKFLLLKAELHYTNGETNAAIEAYDQAVKAAQNHSFIHQVALACELAARFYGNIGHTRCCKNMLQQSHDAYIEWGAALKGEAVLSLQDMKWMDAK